MKVEDPIRTHVSGYLVTPYCPHGNVAGVIAYRRERGIVWTDAEVLAFIGEMAEALFTLHTNKIAHVDFKPENVLIDTDLSYVLSDFGLAQFIDPTTGRPAGGKVTGPIIRRSGQHQPAFGSQSQATQSQATQSQREVSMSRSNRPSQQLVSAHASVSRVRPTVAQLFASCDSQSQNHSFGWQCSGSIANLGASSGHVHPVASVFQHGGGGGYGERSVSVAYSVNTCASQDEGDCRYVSPDMLNRKDHYMAGDLFALGISIFEMLAGEPAPKNGQLHVDLRSGNPVAVLTRCPALTSRPEALLNLMFSLLHPDPMKVPTAFDVLKHDALMGTVHDALALAARATAPIRDGLWVPPPRTTASQSPDPTILHSPPVQSSTPLNATTTTAFPGSYDRHQGTDSRPAPLSPTMLDATPHGHNRPSGAALDFTPSSTDLGSGARDTATPQSCVANQPQFVSTPNSDMVHTASPTTAPGVFASWERHDKGADQLHALLTSPGFPEYRLAKVQLEIASTLVRTQFRVRA
jgi:serine/threonine protein kinase